MARIRYLKPDFFKDEDLATLPFEARLFFAGLWGLADKAGRLEDRPLRLKAEIFPYDKIEAEKCLQQLAQPKASSGKPFIHRYTTDGQRYIQIINWDKHQRPHHTEQDSKIPPAPPLMGTLKGMEKQLEASAELRNGEGTVKKPLKTLQFAYSSDFQEFWKLWPGRWNKESEKIIKVGKRQAALIWAKISEQDKQFVLNLLKTGKIKAAGTQFLPDAFRWLEKKRWEDFA